MTDAPPPGYGPPAGYGPPPGFTPPPGAPPPAGGQPPGPPPPPGEEPPGAPQPSPGGHGSLWLGIGIGVAAFLLVWALSLLVGGTDMYWIPIMAWLGMPPLLLIAGIILAVIPRTRRTGAGILIAVGAGVLIVGGVCVALLTTY